VLEKQAPDDHQLTEYLLGALAPESAEHLDELSIADDAVASRLSAIENDLVDAYARGELSGDIRQRFESFYLSSAKRQEKARFAETLLALERKTAAEAQPSAAQVQPASAEALRLWQGLGRLFSSNVPLQWGLAAAAVLMTLVSGLLEVQQLRLQNRLAQYRTERAALVQRQEQLNNELEQQRSGDVKTLEELQRVRQSLAELEQRTTAKTELSVASFVLLPPVRGVSKLPTLSIPKGIQEVVLLLELESDDFARYGVKLKTAAAGHILWSKANLRSTLSGETKGVTVALPVDLLKNQIYGLELTGISAEGKTEFVSSYTFQVALE